MTKYVNNFDDVTTAKAATGLLAPNVTYIESGETLLMSNLADNTELVIKEEGGQVVIVEKPAE